MNKIKVTKLCTVSGGKTGKKSVHATFITKVVENMCRSRNERIHLQVCGIEF